MTSPKKSNANKRLCKLGKFYIDNNKETSDYDLAEYLDVPIEKVRKYRDQVARKEEEAKKEQEKVELESRKTDVNNTVTIRADDLMIKKSGAVVMTPEASQLGDESRKRSRLSEKIAKNTTTIRPKQ